MLKKAGDAALVRDSVVDFGPLSCGLLPALNSLCSCDLHRVWSRTNSALGLRCPVGYSCSLMELLKVGQGCRDNDRQLLLNSGQCQEKEPLVN